MTLQEIQNLEIQDCILLQRNEAKMNKDFNEMKESEFSKVLKNTKFVDNDPNIDNDGDEIKNIGSGNKKDSLARHLAFASGMIYTILSPVIIMYIAYLLLKKYVLLKDNMLILIIFIFLGILSGYWALFKQIWRKK